jgi:alpha-L-fucosidase
MNTPLLKLLALFLFLTFNLNLYSQDSQSEKDARMDWWRNARFGMFIHWGLYSIPAGEWKGDKSHAEWIRTTAKIPLEEYNKLTEQFNPVKFNAEEWVLAARDAGMKYIVLTSKHHDGFCLWDSDQTDFDVMSTPFKRDILKELADACRKYDMRICWYHSIMDWHHPDYLPRRGWETDRTSEGADFDRYVLYLKNQIHEILTKYGDISVLWFDGEWESTWIHDRAVDLYNYIRSFNKNIIINNRIDVFRDGMAGLSNNQQALGDYGTPEQEIPDKGIPGKDWESCMTMNDHWGYNAADHNWKSASQLIENLVDIASKGGNYLLNVGPTAEGVFPPESIERLKAIGKWMKVNGTAIYGTQAGPFENLGWGRCTQKQTEQGTRLFLHVFSPAPAKIILPGLMNETVKAWLLSDASQTALNILRKNSSPEITLPASGLDDICTVIVLDIKGKPEVIKSPEFSFRYDAGNDKVEFSLVPGISKPDLIVYYTTDGTQPTDKAEAFTKPVALKLPVNFKAVFYIGKKRSSDVTGIELLLSFGKSVSLTKEPSEKYKAQGAASLTDGITGSKKFTDGKWLGFEGDDMEAVIDLGKKSSVRSVKLDYLVNTGSWIFEPVEISVETSANGEKYTTVLTKKFNAALWKQPDEVKQFSDVFPAVNAKYIKITVKNRGTCPETHPGKGSKAWIFVDEISVD